MALTNADRAEIMAKFAFALKTTLVHQKFK